MVHLWKEVADFFETLVPVYNTTNSEVSEGRNSDLCVYCHETLRCHRLWVYENTVMREIHETNTENATGCWRQLRVQNLHNFVPDDADVIKTP